MKQSTFALVFSLVFAFLFFGCIVPGLKGSDLNIKSSANRDLTKNILIGFQSLNLMSTWVPQVTYYISNNAANLPISDITITNNNSFAVTLECKKSLKNKDSEPNLYCSSVADGSNYYADLNPKETKNLFIFIDPFTNLTISNGYRYSNIVPAVYVLPVKIGVRCKDAFSSCPAKYISGKESSYEATDDFEINYKINITN